MDLLNFTKRNFEKPADCRNIEEVRFYVKELCFKIEEFENACCEAPDWAFALLAQYNNRHNQMLSVEFAKTYAT